MSTKQLLLVRWNAPLKKAVIRNSAIIIVVTIVLIFVMGLSVVGCVEQTGGNAGIEHPMQMTIGLTNGHHLYAVRYSSDRASRTLYHSRSISALRQISPMFDQFSEDAIVVVSEPLNEIVEYWEEIQESTVVTIDKLQVETRTFKPQRPD